MWSSDSIPKVVKNGLKAEDLAGTLYVETSYQTYMNASSLNVAPSENNQYFQSSFPYTFSHLEVHSNVEVEPCNTRQESSVFKNAIASNNTAMRNGFYHMEKSDVGNSVMPKSYSLDTEADGNYGNTPSEVKSPSILNLNSLDNFVCDSVLKGSYSTIVSRNVHSFFSSFTDKQNKFSQNLVGHSSDRNQNEPSHSILSSLETDCALLSESDDPNNLAKRGCGSQRTNPLIFSLTESEFECSSSSSMCLMFNDVNVEDGSYLATNNCMQENDVHKANFMTDLNEDFINALVPVVQEDVDVTAYSLSLEEGKFCNDTSYSSFEGQFKSRSLSSGTEVRSNIENAASYQSCQTQENLQVVVEGSLSEEPCPCYNFHMPDSVSEDKIKKCASKLIENQGSSSYYTQGKDDDCICTLMLNGSSISGLPCIVSTLCAQQKSPEKEDSVEHTDGLFYDGISFVDDSDCSELKMYQSSHDASDIAFLLSDYESKIPPSKKGRAMNVPNDESSLNPMICQYDDGKMRDFGHQMTKNVSLFYAKKLEVLDVMKSSHFDSSACASEMTPNLEFFHYGLFQSHRNFFETRSETLKTVDILPSSSWACGEGKEVASDESIEVEKHVVSYIHDASVEPNNVPQAILDNTIFQKDTIMLDECSKNKDRQGRTVGKAKNQVLKSVAGVVTMVGVFVLFLHVSQKKDKEKKNEMGMSFLIQKPNEEFFTKRKIKIGKSDSLYPGEKLKL